MAHAPAMGAGMGGKCASKNNLNVVKRLMIGDIAEGPIIIRGDYASAVFLMIII